MPCEGVVGTAGAGEGICSTRRAVVAGWTGVEGQVGRSIVARGGAESARETDSSGVTGGGPESAVIEDVVFRRGGAGTVRT